MTSFDPNNVFTPAHTVQDIELFAGRRRQLQALADALQARGAHIVLYGQRGVGKSSLALQLIKMANNEAETIDRLARKPFRQLDYVTVFYTCDDHVHTIEDLLRRLLQAPGGLADYVPFSEHNDSSTVSSEGQLGVPGLAKGRGAISSTTTRSRQYVSPDLVGLFTDTCKEIIKSGIAKDGLLIIIDEFDRIQNNSGIASLLKALGPEGVTFVIVGVSNNVQELINEHESVARQLTGSTIEVPLMTEKELSEIVQRAESHMNEEVRFHPDATNWITEVARGHPYYVHLIGKQALLRAIETEVRQVTHDMARTALRVVAQEGLAPAQEAAYKAAIGQSYTREYILKKFAQQLDHEIHTTAIYEEVGNQLAISKNAVSVYVGHLTTATPPVLVSLGNRYYRFKDSLFKAYAEMRPFILRPPGAGTEQNVDGD